MLTDTPIANCTCSVSVLGDRNSDIFVFYFEDTQTFSLSVCLCLCLCHSDTLCCSVCLSQHAFTLSLVRQKANMPVNSRRHIGFTPSSEQIKTTEGGVAHILCNSHTINHICCSFTFSLIHTHTDTHAHHLQLWLCFIFSFHGAAIKKLGCFLIRA